MHQRLVKAVARKGDQVEVGTKMPTNFISHLRMAPGEASNHVAPLGHVTIMKAQHRH